MSLSIPRRIVVTDEKVEVRCLLDITEIRRDEIASVRPGRPSADEMVLSGIRGLRVLRLLRTFPRPQAVRTRKTLRLGVENFVEITDIYEDRLYVSCSDAGRLVEELMPPGGNRPAEDDEEEEQAQ
mgnify:CR=1 FL=1